MMRTEIPKHGEIRYRRRFAWLPTVIGSVSVWFEKYIQIEEYMRYGTADKGQWRTIQVILSEDLPSKLEQQFNKNLTD